MRRKNAFGSFAVAFGLIVFTSHLAQAADTATVSKPVAGVNTAPAAPAAPASSPAAGPAPQTASAPSAPGADPEVKKAKASGICHDKSSPSYKQTKNFLPFNSMDECLKSGGKPLKK